MAKLGCLFAAIGLACSSAIVPIRVTGELLLGIDGPLQIRECVSGQIYELGPMTKRAVFQLQRRIETLPTRPPRSVMVVLDGVTSDRVDMSGDQGVVHLLERPRIVTVSEGTCAQDAA